MILAWSPSALAQEVVDRVAAIVEDDVIALSEIYDIGGPFIEERCEGRADACWREAEIEVLDSLILRVLIHQELRKLGLDVTRDELDRTIDQLARDYGIPDVETLRREVEASGATWSEYREQVTEQLRTMKFQEAIIRPRVSVSDDELLDAYKRGADEFTTPSTADVSAITMPLPDEITDTSMAELITKARGIVAQINDGEVTWDEALAEHHVPGIVGADGALGPVRQGEFLPAIDKVIFSAEVGTVADPVVAGGKVFLLRVNKVDTSGTLPFEDVRSAVMAKVYEKKISEQSQAWYLQARRRASVKILLEEP